MLSSFLLLYTLLLFISFFLSSKFWYVLWVGVEMFLKKAQTLWLTVYLSSSSLSLHTKIQEKKKKVELKHCLWYLGIGGCARDRQLQVWNSVLFTYFLVFGTTKSWFLGKLGTIGIKRKEIEDFWFLSDLSFCMKVWFLLRWVRIFCVICRLCEWKFGFFLSLIGWICVVFAICRCSLNLSWHVGFTIWIFTQIR